MPNKLILKRILLKSHIFKNVVLIFFSLFVALGFFFIPGIPGWLMLIVVMASLCFDCFILGKITVLWSNRPDFISHYCGVAVWTGGTKYINQTNFNQVIQIIVSQLANLAYYDVDQMLGALQKISIVFQRMPVVEPQFTEAMVREKFNGAIKVRWGGYFSRSTLMHELVHVFDYYLRRGLVDYKHTGSQWVLVGTINARLRQEGL